jgi:RNA polymerase sigma factor (sigma-70 family)
MKLSPRETEVLHLIVEAELSNAAIAQKLGISTGTVDTHRKKLLLKLSVKNSVGLTKMAIKKNYITL